jgi:hypothetical protein
MPRAKSRKAEAPVNEAFTAGVEDDTPVVAVVPDTPNPAFVMSDDPAVPDQFLRRPPPLAKEAQETPPIAPVTSPSTVPAVGGTTYEHRIRVVEVFHYAGSLRDAPGWISRDWIAYGDYDEKRKLPAGPALLVPTPRTPTGTTLCRNGDYVVKQEVLLARGLDPDEQIEVWEKDAFERLFIPVAVSENLRIDEEAAP